MLPQSKLLCSRVKCSVCLVAKLWQCLPSHKPSSWPETLPTFRAIAGSAAHDIEERESRLVPSRRAAGPAFAALDLGTNNCRMLVGTPHGSSFRVIDSFSRIVRLGE